MKSKKLKGLLVVVAMLSILALVGCGQGKDKATTTGEASSQTLDEAKDEGQAKGGADSADNQDKNQEKSGKLEKLRLVLDYTPNTNHTGLFVAKELGYFKDNGIDMDIEQPPEGSTTQLIGSGGGEFGISFQDTLAKNFSSKTPVPVTAVAAILQHNTSGIISPKSENIVRPKDIDNKTYATWDDPIELAMLKNIINSDGGDFNTVKKVPYSENVIAQLSDKSSNGANCAWVFYAWDGISFKIHNIDTNFISFAKENPKLDYYTPVLIANNDFLKNKPELAKKAIAAMKKGYEYAVEHPNEAAHILMKYAPELDEKLAVASQEYISKEYIKDAKEWGVFDANRWNTFYDWLYAEKLIDIKIPENYGFSNDYLK